MTKKTTTQHILNNDYFFYIEGKVMLPKLDSSFPKIGTNELTRCIEEYVKPFFTTPLDLTKSFDRMAVYQNLGNTFHIQFDSEKGYYLDEISWTSK